MPSDTGMWDEGSLWREREAGFHFALLDSRGGASVAPPCYTLNVNIEMPVVGWRLPARRSGSTRSGATWLHLATDARRSSRVSVLLWVIFEPSVVGVSRNRKEIQSVERLERCIREFGGFGREEGWFWMFACEEYACSLLWELHPWSK